MITATGDRSDYPTNTPPGTFAPPKTLTSWKVAGSAAVVKSAPAYTRTRPAFPCPLPTATAALIRSAGTRGGGTPLLGSHLTVSVGTPATAATVTPPRSLVFPPTKKFEIGDA